MESIFAKPPPSVPQHYKMLLQKKEATLHSLHDCFAPATASPTHLYTPEGIQIGQRKSSSLVYPQSSALHKPAAADRFEPATRQVKAQPPEDLRAELEQYRLENAQLSDRIRDLEALLRANNIDF